MFLEEEGVGLRGWCTVSVAGIGAPSSRAPHLLQNSLFCGGTAEHDGQSLNWLSFAAQLVYEGQIALAIVQRNSSSARFDLDTSVYGGSQWRRARASISNNVTAAIISRALGSPWTVSCTRSAEVNHRRQSWSTSQQPDPWQKSMEQSPLRLIIPKKLRNT